MADAIKLLKSGDPSRVRGALEDVRASGKAGASAVPAILDLLDDGMSPALTLVAIEALGDVESEPASPALASYARHRNVGLRRAAVAALAKTRGAAAVQALRAALADSDSDVRAAAATGLGALGANEAVGDLLVALDHHVNEAAGSIGRLCAGAQCDQLTSRVSHVRFDALVFGLEPILLRGSPEVDDEAKLRVVARVRDLATAEANKFLKDVQGRWPAGGAPRVKQALDQAVIATNGAAPAPRTEGETP